ncbi:right-handed parallel beta-helix repeat-containing protein [Hahella aquimaris]|uniref:right-handed parallel beta-helix repeat-containing protein n=1 Tax=Hahella sp. HNIBRBA332 TaxID=3015983 RepID=UPI00273CCE0C|nr:right-handed parallel beta-helix repeat-containing protein [Hahella sp. HNIBRBA332]WLQ11728.1 right-handed parallel beta-helix repeat-containing protein [Hahella sp. HNIBRBA332]
MKSAIGALFGCALSGACFATNLNIIDYGATPDDHSDDDSIAINAAINAARDGDTVIIPEGTFHTREEIILKSRVNLKGAGYAKSTITAVYTSMGNDDEHQTLIKGKNLSSVTISGLRLKTTHSEGVSQLISIIDSENVSVNESSFYRFIKHAIYFNNTINGRVADSRFQDATITAKGGHGYGVVYTNGCDRGRVDDSYFYGPDIRHGVVIQGDKKTNRPSHGITVNNNYFKDTKQDAIDLHGTGEYDNIVIDNTIVGDPNDKTLGRGIGVGEDVHGPSGSGNIIKNNVIRNTLYGIHVLAGSPDVKISGNKIYNCDRMGIFIENGQNVDVRANTVEGCKWWGIYVENGDNTTIASGSKETNEVHGNGWGSSGRWRYPKVYGNGGVRVMSQNSGMNVRNNNFCDNESNGGPNFQFEGQGTVLNNQCQ